MAATRVIAIALLCIAASSFTCALSDSGHIPGAAGGKGFAAGGKGGKGYGAGGKGGKGGKGLQGNPWAGFRYNASLSANLTDAANKNVGGVIMSLFFNTNNSDYDLSYNLKIKVPAGDTAKSAVVLSGADTVFVISNTLPTRGNSSTASVAGRVRNLGTIKAANNDNALDVVKAMFAAPAKYTVKVTSTQSPDGLATGTLSKWSIVDLMKNIGKNAADRSKGSVRGRH